MRTTMLAKSNLNLHNCWQTILTDNSSFEPAQIIVKGYEYRKKTVLSNTGGVTS